MASEIKKLIRARAVKKAKFSRQCLCAKVKLVDTWRRPRGLHSKQRKDFRAKGAHPEAGFGSPVAIRGFHPSGYREVLVFRPIDLEEIDAATTAARIGAAVGRQKRAAIQTKAAALGIKILNPKEIMAVVAVPVTEEEVKSDE
ncbi:MAG: 50S ribosomal protein L32e [Methanocalculaceae archaeon]|nr:50S ribosomal protein L32e [Methanocalculaceae archaeon]